MKNCQKCLQKIISKILKHLSLIFGKILRVFTYPPTIWAILLRKKEKNLVQIATKVVLDSEVSTSIKIAQQLGQNQYNELVRDRIFDNKKSFYNILRKTKLRLFKQNSLMISSKKTPKYC